MSIAEGLFLALVAIVVIALLLPRQHWVNTTKPPPAPPKPRVRPTPPAMPACKPPKEDVEMRIAGDLQRVNLQPGDVFVFSVDTPVSAEQEDWIQAYWKKRMGDLPMFVVDSRAKLQVFGPPKTLEDK